MGFATRRDLSCTLCSSSFRLRWGPMIHPADVLCDACITRLWELQPEGAAAVEGFVQPQLTTLMTMPVTDLLGAITERAERLREIVTTRAELEAMLLARRNA